MNGNVIAIGGALILIGWIVLAVKSKGRSVLRTVIGSLIILIGLVIILSVALVWTDVLVFFAGFLDVLSVVASWIEALGHWIVDICRGGATYLRDLAA